MAARSYKGGLGTAPSEPRLTATARAQRPGSACLCKPSAHLFLHAELLFAGLALVLSSTAAILLQVATACTRNGSGLRGPPSTIKVCYLLASRGGARQGQAGGEGHRGCPSHNTKGNSRYACNARQTAGMQGQCNARANSKHAGAMHRRATAGMQGQCNAWQTAGMQGNGSKACHNQAAMDAAASMKTQRH